VVKQVVLQGIQKWIEVSEQEWSKAIAS
jgi:hypothetical protein